MSKENKTFFECSNCGAQYTKWVGRCLECGKWGTVSKTPTQRTGDAHGLNSKSQANASAITTVTLDEIENKKTTRITTSVGELDRVLGGGLVSGSLILLGGEPGIGKSTLALQIASLLPNTIYISGEESVEQIKIRADRLGIKNNSIRLGNSTHVESIIATIRETAKTQPSSHTSSSITGKDSVPSSKAGGFSFAPAVAIVDSIQTIYSDEVEGSSGNINQVRACTVKLMEFAKSSGIIVMLIGQVTKEGTVAGPKTLEHLVDVVLYLEGDKFHNFRVLRAAKNRFGSTDEIGVFFMEEKGLQEIANPSAAFLSGKTEEVPGSAVTCLIEGSRPVLVEIQALVTKTNFGYPQRRASGFELNRLQVLIGVLTKRTGLPLDSYDVFLNVVGGLNAEEPAADLAVALSIASAMRDKTLPRNLVAFGEIGLGGEIRSVSGLKKRLEEIKKMGYEFAVIPPSDEAQRITGLKIVQVKNVKELVERIVT